METMGVRRGEKHKKKGRGRVISKRKLEQELPFVTHHYRPSRSRRCWNVQMTTTKQSSFAQVQTRGVPS